MQKELDLIDTTSEIQILGVNGVGLESGNAAITNGRTLPWLQDVADQQVWTSWAITYRDVVILDEKNEVYAVYNLTTYDLANANNYATLKNLLIQAAND